MRVIRTIVSKLYLYVLWAFLAVLLLGSVFLRLTDTDAAHKVVLFADVPAINDRELAWALEQKAPAGIRMVQVHPFSYAMFDAENLLSADLYIIPESHVEDYAGSFRSLEGAGFDPEGGYLREGKLWGLRVWDHQSGQGVAAEYIQYPNEDYWLFINGGSRHIRSLTGEGDDAALAVARELLKLTAGPGE